MLSLSWSAMSTQRQSSSSMLRQPRKAGWILYVLLMELLRIEGNLFLEFKSLKSSKLYLVCVSCNFWRATVTS